VSNQIRGFLIERGITVRQGLVPLRKAVPEILSSNTNALSPRMVALIADPDAGLAPARPAHRGGVDPSRRSRSTITAASA
jgi:hypothetical protein